MTWHYQMRKMVDSSGETYYDIVEVYTDPVGHTENSIAPIGDSPKGLIRELTRMKRDALKYGILGE